MENTNEREFCIDEGYYCSACGSHSHRADAQTGMCYECGADAWEEEKLITPLTPVKNKVCDFLGRPLEPGDGIIYIYSGTTGSKRLMQGIIEKIERGLVYVSDTSYTCYDNDPHDSKNKHVWDGRYTNQVKLKSSSIYKIV